MKLAEVPMPDVPAGHVLVAIHLSGVNFLDAYFRSGLYKAELPVTLGSEAAGVIERVGEGVTGLAAGDRVAYTMIRGSYAEYAVVPAANVVRVPDAVTLETAAAVMLQGTTAHYLTRSTFPLGKEHTCLVHAAAGGAGSMIVQMARAAGARVFGTVSTAAKAEKVRARGADAAIVYTEQDFEAEVKRLTEGRGVDVVYDSVGQTTFDKGLRVLRPRGMMVLFGQASGPVPPFDPNMLAAHGSLFLTRPTLANHLSPPDELKWRVDDVMGMLASGAITVDIFRTYDLADAAQAHRDLESRATTGKLLLRVR